MNRSIPLVCFKNKYKNQKLLVLNIEEKDGFKFKVYYKKEKKKGFNINVGGAFLGAFVVFLLVGEGHG